MVHRLTPSALSKDRRFVTGCTTECEDFIPGRSNIVRVPSVPGGKVCVLLHRAGTPSFNGSRGPVSIWRG